MRIVTKFINSYFTFELPKFITLIGYNLWNFLSLKFASILNCLGAHVSHTDESRRLLLSIQKYQRNAVTLSAAAWIYERSFNLKLQHWIVPIKAIFLFIQIHNACLIWTTGKKWRTNMENWLTVIIYFFSVESELCWFQLLKLWFKINKKKESLAFAISIQTACACNVSIHLYFLCMKVIFKIHKYQH